MKYNPRGELLRWYCLGVKSGCTLKLHLLHIYMQMSNGNNKLEVPGIDWLVVLKEHIYLASARWVATFTDPGAAGGESESFPALLTEATL